MATLMPWLWAGMLYIFPWMLLNYYRIIFGPFYTLCQQPHFWREIINLKLTPSSVDKEFYHYSQINEYHCWFIRLVTRMLKFSCQIDLRKHNQYVCIYLQVSTLRWNQCHGCWWPGNTRNQCINSHATDPVSSEYPSLSNRGRVEDQ